MDAKQREERRMEAVKRLRAGEHAAVVALDLGVGTNAVYMWGKPSGYRPLINRVRSKRPIDILNTHNRSIHLRDPGGAKRRP